MKRIFKLLFALALIASPAYADVKISALPSLASVTTDDLTICVDNPSGAPITSKCTVGALQTIILTGNGSNLTGLTVTQLGGSYTDTTTNNVSTSAHGLTPKAPNDATKFLDGTGAWTVPSNASAGGFTDDGATVRLTTAGDALAIGTATQNGSNKLTVSGGVYVSGTITGNATTASAATALAANGSNCNAGSAPLGVDASGASESCFTVVRPIDIDTSAELRAILTDETGTGTLVFNTAPTFSGTVTATAFVGDGSALTGVGSAAIDTSAKIAAIVTDEVGTGKVVFNDSPTFTTLVNLPSAAAPTITVIGDTAIDNNLWASGRGAVETYDGTAITALVGVLVSDTPSNGQVLKWNAGGTITWENDNNSASITCADTGIMYSDGANSPSCDATNFHYNKTTHAIYADSFIANSSATASYIQLYEASGNGTNYRKFAVASSLAGDATITLDGTDATTMTFPTTTQTLVGKTSTDTLTNKRITKRTGTTASSATPTINTDSYDRYTITALAAAITSFTSSLSGTPVDGDPLEIRIKDDGTARTIAWGASFASRGATLPTTTVLGKYLYVKLEWNSQASIWDCIAVSQEL